MTPYIIIGIVIIVGLFAARLPHRPSFGRLPRGERLERIHQSPNYRNGAFRNSSPTRQITSDKGSLQILLGFLFDRPEGRRPKCPVPAIKTDLKKLTPDSDWMVWFGHSSYLLQLSRKRILVDPVFHAAAPFPFLNKPFKGTDIYKSEDMPDIDFLIITHDHWDHLDYWTVTRLKGIVGKVVCPLGVGEHFELWGFDKGNIIELDWHENASVTGGFSLHCLPARHFSGRGITQNQTLWASFLLETPCGNVYIGGDGGYGSHFQKIGNDYPKIDLAILENGQYNENWRHIHTMPWELGHIAEELKSDQIITVHHSKYALSRHRWDEPLRNETEAAAQHSLNLIVPIIGQVVPLNFRHQDPN